MKNIEIKKETLPERCDVCHKRDYFDPKNNYCLRCKDILITNPQTKNKNSSILETFAGGITTAVLLFVFIVLWIGLFS